MSKVAIVTDSTAYIPDDLVKQYGITVAPQVLIWGEETFQDGVDISPTEFYSRLATATIMPTTSQVAVPTFKEIFEKLHADGKEILVILLSDQLSKSLNSAELARQMVPDAKIELVNSKSTAMELGFHVLAAARAAEVGATLVECKEIAEEAQEKTRGVVRCRYTGIPASWRAHWWRFSIAGNSPADETSAGGSRWSGRIRREDPHQEKSL